MFTKRLILAVALAIALPAAASAVTIHATGVTQYAGTGITGPRADATRALGAADGKFMSLGLGGAAVFSFPQAFTGPASIVEVTFGSRPGHVETARVFVSETFTAGAGAFDAGLFREVGSISNVGPVSVIDFGGTYRFLALLDTSPRRPGRDGFDIDSIAVTTAPVAASIAAVPLPASAPLLLLGLAAMAWIRRRAR